MVISSPFWQSSAIVSNHCTREMLPRKTCRQRVEHSARRFSVVLFSMSILLGACDAPSRSAGGGACPEPTTVIEIGSEFTIHSDILGEDRPYRVYLPRSYSDDVYYPRKYPVVYLLDGVEQFHMISGLIRYMSEGLNGNWQIPELILVAIPNTNRVRDLTPTHSVRRLNGEENEAFEPSGGGARFLEFLEKELIPAVESAYRVQPHRTYVGHSFGGLSAILALIEKPSLFQGYILMDPSLWWDGEVLVKRAGSVLPKRRDVHARIFIAQAGYESATGSFDRTTWDRSFSRFTDVLAKSKLPHLEFRHEIYGNEDHVSLPVSSAHDGLRYVFPGYRIGFAELSQGADSIAQHFEQVSATLGFRYPPPEHMVDRHARFTFDKLGDAEKALHYLELNAANYPSSPHVYESLGEVYAAMGEAALAEHNLSKAEALRSAGDAEPRDAQGPSASCSRAGH